MDIEGLKYTFVNRPAGEFKIGDIDEDEKSIITRISTAAIDRDNEIVRPDGVVLEAYRKNPVVLFQHGRLGGLPIGKNVWIKNVNNELIAKTVYFTEGDAGELGRKVFEYRKAGFPLGQSIGFRALKTVRRPYDLRMKSDEWEAELKKLQKLGWLSDEGKDKLKAVVQRWEMLEYSDVVVPANPDAVNLAFEHGLISEKDVERLTIKTLEDETVVIIDDKETEDDDVITVSLDVETDPDTTDGNDDGATTEEPDKNPENGAPTDSNEPRLVVAADKEFLIVEGRVYPVEKTDGDAIEALELDLIIKQVLDVLVNVGHRIDDLETKLADVSKDTVTEDIKSFITDVVIQQTRALSGALSKTNDDIMEKVFAAIKAAGLFRVGKISWK